jgi:CubicO group peptidase (beta-lactamase class C family)
MPAMSMRFALAIFFLFPVRVCADAELEKAIDALAAKHHVTAKTPGVAVAIIEPGKAPVYKTYGLANIARGTPIASYTTFELASLSKPMTALVILILCDRGLMSLNDPVRKHIPELPVYYPKQPLLVRDLLHHVSGLPEYFDLDWPKPPHNRKYWMNEDLVGAFGAQRNKVRAKFAPEAKFAYCNTNFYLLAVIASRVASESFGKLLHKEILGPLKMNASFSYDHPGATVKHPLHGFVNALAYGPPKKKGQPWQVSWGSPPYRNETNLIVGDGGTWSSLEDMQKLDAALRAGKLVRKATMDAALTPSKTKDGKTNDYGFGLGLSLGNKGKLIGYGHNGGWGGFHTIYHRDLLANRGTSLLGRLCRKIPLVPRLWCLTAVFRTLLALKHHAVVSMIK